MAGARSRRKTGTHFSGSRSKTWILEGTGCPKRKPGQKTGQALLVAPQYSQESPENNALFAIWLADLGSNQPASATLGLFGGCDPARHFLKLLFGGLERRRL
jgi:hypothetical protein